MSSDQVPDSARVVVIGGGIIGCSIAYHLGHLGWNCTSSEYSGHSDSVSKRRFMDSI